MNPRALRTTLVAAMALGCFAAVAASPDLVRGRRIFLEGVGASEIVARIGATGAKVPASVLTCAGCHGIDGRGASESGVSAPDIRAAALARPARNAGATLRSRPAYDRERLVRAITQGVDSGGQPLHVAMPRYAASGNDLGTLVDFLQALGASPEVGVLDETIRIGVVAPSRGRAGEVGRAVRDVLASFVANGPEARTLNGRRLELVAVEADGTVGAASAAERLVREDVLAVVAPVFDGAAARSEAERRLIRAGVPVIGPIGPATARRATPLPVVFDLIPSVEDFVRVLMEEARCPDGGGIIVAAGEPWRSSAETVLRESGGAGASWRLEPASREAQAARDAARCVVLLGDPDEVGAAIPLLLDGAPDATVATLAALVDPAKVVTPRRRGRLLLAVPGPDEPRASEALARFVADLNRNGIEARHPAIQMLARDAMDVAVEALRRAGRDLSRERLVAALESSSSVSVTSGSAVSFGPNRHHGMREIHVLELARR